MMTLLQTCIGLALMYFLASLLVGALIEYLAAMFKLRSRLLKQALDKMLGNAEVVLDNVLVQAANPQQVAPDDQPLPSSAARLHRLSNLFYRGPCTPSYLAPSLFALALMKHPAPTPQAQRLLEMMRLVPRVIHGGSETLQQELETWYNEAMKRWEGVYTRWTQAISLVLCLFLVPLLNIDTVKVAKYLWVTPEARAAVAQKANEVLRDNAAQTPATAPALPASEQGTDEQVAAKQQTVQQAQKALADLNLPLGWEGGLSGQKFLAHWQVGLVGWLLSIVAIAAGSRFWFDLLGRLVNLRLTGPPPATPEGSTAKS